MQIYKICVISLFILCGVLQASDNMQVKTYSPECEQLITQVADRLGVLGLHFEGDPYFEKFSDTVVGRVVALAKLQKAGMLQQQQFDKMRKKVLQGIPRAVFNEHGVIGFEIGS